MGNIKTYEEYRFFKGRETVPGYDWKKGEYTDVPNEKDKNEPFFNVNKPEYWDKKNKDSEKRKKQWDVDSARYKEEKVKKIAKTEELMASGVLDAENIIEVREVDGPYRGENDYYKFILKDGRKFKYHMSYSYYEQLGERADFEGATLTEYGDKGKIKNEWFIYDEKTGEELAEILRSKLGKYTDKWEYGDNRDDEYENDDDV